MRRMCRSFPAGIKRNKRAWPPLGPVVRDGLGPTGDYGHSPDKYLELFTIEPGIRFAQALLEKLFGEKMKKERERNHAF